MSAQSSAMASVADNITNINTVGYKNADTQFRTLVADGRTGVPYAAAGTAAVTQSLVSKQGVLQASASSTDVGIQGAGFFVTKDGTDASANLAYTRAGSFTPDDDGYLQNSGGYYLQGWPLDATTGKPTSTDASGLVPVRVSQLNGAAAATSKLNMAANLNQTTTPVTLYNATTAPAGYKPGDIAVNAVHVADPTANPTVGTAAQFSKSFDVSDAQGGKHSVTLAFVKTGTNTWAGEVYATPASDVTQTNGLLASGKVAFNPDGSLNVAGSDPGIVGTLTGSATLAPIWNNGTGTGSIKLGLGTDKGTDGLTQNAGISGMKTSSVDGGLLGSVASTKISKDGIVSAVFADGSSRAVFQLPLASVPNPNGMTRLPGNAYAVSSESGGVAINSAGNLGTGSISSGTLEASTVDLAQEFTNMIRFQRAYSASSKIITTVDDMLQEVSNLKR